MIDPRHICLTVVLAIGGLCSFPAPTVSADPPKPTGDYDIVIYGGTSAAVVAAVQAKRMGKSVVVVSPDKHIGGLTSGGLGWTDTGDKSVIGGLAREFYHRVWQYYQSPDAWRWQTREGYGNRGQGTAAIDGQQRTMWIFEPHVAEQVFDQWLQDEAIEVVRDAWLDREHGVRSKDGRIVSITTLDRQTFAGKMFIDATYEGDLLATAGIDYHVGRESQDTYDEQWNGIQTGVLHHRHHFGVLDRPIDPYRIPGDSSSGLLPRIQAGHPGEFGAGDHRIQAYCFRMCLTQIDENRVAFAKPSGYDPEQYELVLRVFDAGWRETFQKFDPIPNEKTDTNNHGPFSTDNIGFNYDYPEASYEDRQKIIREHRTYQQGLMYFVANDPRVPSEVRQAMSRWGLAKDEFVDNDHWPHQLYIREARRMVGRYVMTENELLKRRPTPEPIGMGSYTMDSHNVQRYVTAAGAVQNEGDIGVSTQGPYQIALGAVLPKDAQCGNLLVPVCVSSSHIAFGSIRMEPVFMILGQSTATIAAMAIDHDVAVQEVDYALLRTRLIADGQVLEAANARGQRGVDPARLAGVIVDDSQAELTGDWTPSRAVGRWVGQGYRHEQNKQDGSATATFTAMLPTEGRFEVRLAYSPSENRSGAVTVIVDHADGQTTRSVDQRKGPPIDGLWVSLGKFRFEKGGTGSVIVSNKKATGFVIVDAVQWMPIDGE